MSIGDMNASCEDRSSTGTSVASQQTGIRPRCAGSDLTSAPAADPQPCHARTRLPGSTECRRSSVFDQLISEVIRTEPFATPEDRDRIDRHVPTGIHLQLSDRPSQHHASATSCSIRPPGCPVLSLAKAAKDYYLQKLGEFSPREDYYLRGGTATGLWRGSGAAELGLEGSVCAEDLVRLFDGEHPSTGDQLGRRLRKDGVAAWDVTFSADKSVSLTWALSDEETRHQVLEAFDEANYRRLRVLGVGGVVHEGRFENTGHRCRRQSGTQ